MLWWRLRQLHSKHASVRAEAARRLGESKDQRIVEPLIAALEDEDPLVRAKVALALGWIGDQRAVAPLLNALASPNAPLRRAAVQALMAMREPQAVEPLVGLLNNQSMRQLAIEALIAIGTPSVEPLLIRLTDRDSEIRTTVAKALGQIGDTHAVNALVATIQDQDQAVRRAAAQSLEWLGWKPADDTEHASFAIALQEWQILARLGNPAVKPLTAALKDQSQNIRIEAANTLGEIKTAHAIEALLNNLEDPSSNMRVSVVRSLGRIGDTRAAIRLVATLNDNDPSIRAAATEAFQRLGAVAIDPLVGALRNPDAELRHVITQLLGEIEDERALPALEAMLSDTDVQVATAAVEALGRFGMTGCERLVIGLTYGRSDVRRAAANMLITLGWQPERRAERAQLAIALGQWNEAAVLGTAAVKPLIAMLGDTDPDQRLSAVQALISIGKPVFKPLVAALADERWEVRQMAAYSFSYIKEPQAVEPLINLTSDLSTSVRKDAVLALGSIGDTRAIEPLKTALHDRSAEVQVAAARSLRRFDWQPANDEEFILYAIADNQWGYLAQKGMPQAIDPLLKQLYETPLERLGGHYCGSAKDIPSVLMTLVPVSALDEELATWIVEAATYDYIQWSKPRDNDRISLDRCNRAIRLLCNVNTPLTSNILHLIARKKDIAVTLHSRCSPSWEETINFQTQRHMALQELQRRGNPPYESGAYLKVEGRGMEAERRQVAAALQQERDRRYREILALLEKQQRSNNDNSYDYIRDHTIELYGELARDFKTPEVYNMLVKAMSRYRFMTDSDRRKFQGFVADVERNLSKGQIK